MPSYHMLTHLLWILLICNAISLCIMPWLTEAYCKSLARHHHDPAYLEHARTQLKVPLAWAMCSYGMGLILYLSLYMFMFPVPATVPGVFILLLAQGFALYTLTREVFWPLRKNEQHNQSASK